MDDTTSPRKRMEHGVTPEMIKAGYEQWQYHAFMIETAEPELQEEMVYEVYLAMKAREPSCSDEDRTAALQGLRFGV